MFDLLSRLPRLPLKGALPAALSNPARMMARNRASQRAWPGAMVGRLVDHLLREGSFASALSDQPGFSARRGAEGITCLRNEAHLCGAILTPRSAALQFAVTGAETFAGHTLNPLLQARFGSLPPWHAQAAGLEIAIPLAPAVTLALRLRDAPVDPLFIGRNLPGLCVDLAVQLAD
ncbi:MAG: hypothetical protein JNN06_08310 [Gemmobacter sp.]|uniref:hypothetical protein n=1 Tax=Gemmobacter sp. TaxID=1898957 RepID=UPI001A5F7E91|nr:hypothetical protein [Gemmobacter sp.]MBL8562270.1 hypothetical protein [Gemmobacter sp.]